MNISYRVEQLRKQNSSKHRDVVSNSMAFSSLFAGILLASKHSNIEDRLFDFELVHIFDGNPT